ncbi:MULTISPECIES: histidine kinase [Roseivirga]|jgi:LytS/YehU family sensor histidine kinase|uniref:Histidine kinase n=1 Tax=Roseivirga thermotolerans TaxID=1758176 RepID=A0ABQ3HZN4_9BACT|nr:MULTISPECIES: histidine kinase [Roseivirga]GHE51127.1 histidine kinase [Roseivirga thermotolerans]|tara:strand:+ start:7477 stop:8517 length:1041 start_codon:yes stop_codon:yes gene_type:complete
MNKRVVYWICQVGGWGLYTLFLIGMIALFGGENSITRSTLILQSIIYVSLILFSHLFRLHIQRKNWLDLSIGKLIPRAILGTFITATLAQIFIHIIIYLLVPLSGISGFSWGGFVGYVFNIFLVLILWAAIYFIIKFIEKNRNSELEKLELKSALQEAELMILKNQVNPHFLFNALNNIRSLILVEPEKARKMVTHISDLLRYSIQFNASEKVGLKAEIEIVKDYLQLESIQFQERLRYTFTIDPETENVQIPPMAIQLLVENAIKHGLSTQKGGGEIHIKTNIEQNHLLIEVTNSGQLKPIQKREGVGLKNLVERMKILFGHFAEFRLENSSKETVTATLKIPLK